MAVPEHVRDPEDRANPLLVWSRQVRRTGRRSSTAPMVRVRCGCGESVVICHPVKGQEEEGFLEIAGVDGTVAKWRKVLLPLLNVELVK